LSSWRIAFALGALTGCASLGGLTGGDAGEETNATAHDARASLEAGRADTSDASCATGGATSVLCDDSVQLLAITPPDATVPEGLYWTTSNASVATCSLPDCAATRASIASEQTRLEGIGVSGRSAYWATTAGGNVVATCQLLECGLPGHPQASAIADAGTATANSLVVTPTAEFFYWTASSGAVYQTNKTSGATDRLVTIDQVGALATDLRDRYVAFVQQAPGTIEGCALAAGIQPGCDDAGSQSIASNQTGALAVAFAPDDDGGVPLLYWVNTVTNAIDGCPATGCPAGGPSVTIAAGEDSPTSIAVDESYVYWANDPRTSESGGSIVAGCRSTACTPVTLATGQASPGSLVLDGQFVYWVNQGAAGGIFKVAKP
jgi:hypothetical protein